MLRMKQKANPESLHTEPICLVNYVDDVVYNKNTPLSNVAWFLLHGFACNLIVSLHRIYSHVSVSLNVP